jgi:hypothetical protein
MVVQVPADPVSGERVAALLALAADHDEETDVSAD